MLSTGEIDSEFVSKHEFGNEWLASTSDPYFEFPIFTSTGRDFDSIYSESFSIASTPKCNSMVELFASTGRGFDSSIIAIFSFASTGKCNSMVELFGSTGRDFDSLISTIFSFARTVPGHKNPGYQKRIQLRMSPILHPTNFADFALLYKIVCCLAMARQQKRLAKQATEVIMEQKRKINLI